MTFPNPFLSPAQINNRQTDGFSSPPKYVSGRYYGAALEGTSSTATVTANTLHFCQIYIATSTTFTAIGSFPTVASSISAHAGIYTDIGNAPGSLISGSDVTIAPLTAAASNDFTFATAITLQPGYYWTAILTNGSATIVSQPTGGSNAETIGIGVMSTSSTGLGVRVTASQTYGALPGTAPAVTYTDASTMVLLPLKAQ